MIRWWLRLLVSLVMVLTLSACESPRAAQEIEPSARGSSLGQEETAERENAAGTIGSGSMPTGWSTIWPDYVPDEIPPLDGDIRNVMEGQSHIRIFYSSLSQEDFEEYLRSLEDNGFRLEYVVYYDERYPDDQRTQERIEQGDFDTVEITRGEYHLSITHGGGDTVLDIYTSGWEDAYPLTPVREWPADLTDVPVPERCRIEAVYTQDSGGYQIVCRPDDAEAVAIYYQTLQASGYLPTDLPRVARAPVDGDYRDVLARDDTEITLEYSPSVSTMRLTVWRIQSSGLSDWPAELEGIIPQPAGSVVDMVQEWGELEYMISCRGRSDGLLAEYTEQLIAAGFGEIRRTEAADGALNTVTLFREPYTVDLSSGPMAELTIRITDEAISYAD